MNIYEIPEQQQVYIQVHSANIVHAHREEGECASPASLHLFFYFDVGAEREEIKLKSEEKQVDLRANSFLREWLSCPCR